MRNFRFFALFEPVSCLPLPSCFAEQYPGTVLLRLGMGPTEEMPRLTWLQTLSAQLPSRREFQFRIHIFQVPPSPAPGIRVLLCMIISPCPGTELVGSRLKRGQ